MSVAIIGASGFVGLRLVERLHLGGVAEVVPIVHAPRSLAVLARFALPWRVADPSDPVALADALQGCDVLVHAALGDANQIVRMAKALFPAAERAGIKRIVALSSAAVHSLTPAQGTDESTPILINQPSEYNVAKARAEQLLDDARQRSHVELVQLRPSIIYGPRSRMIANIASQLIEATAYLIDDGHGICNAISVDNLVDAIWLSLTTPGAVGQTFLLNDRELITWRDMYSAIANAIGTDLGGVHFIETPPFRSSPSENLARLAAGKPALAVLPFIPARVKRIAKAAAKAWAPEAQPDAWRLPELALPTPSEEMCLLQSCRWRYPTNRAEQILGYTPTVSFAEAMQRTGAWLKFVGLTRAHTTGLNEPGPALNGHPSETPPSGPGRETGEGESTAAALSSR